MVIIILGILAAITLPKFVNFKAQAIENTEASIFGAMNTAIKIQYSANVVAGNNSWPDCLLFTLITNPPPYMQFTDGVAGDGYYWRYLRWSYYFIFYCPHWNGTLAGGAGGATKGNWYWYILWRYLWPVSSWPRPGRLLQRDILWTLAVSG